MLRTAKYIGGSFYGVAFEAWCHCILLLGGEFVLGDVIFRRQRSNYSASNDKDRLFEKSVKSERLLADYRCVQCPNGCVLGGLGLVRSWVMVSVNPGHIMIADAPSVEETRLVVFQMTVGKEHRLGQSHSHFDRIKSPRHPSSESKPLFLFVISDESFPSFRIDLKRSGL